jgi:hypothetical protein
VQNLADILNVTVGKQYAMNWRVIAGDGSGDVTGLVDVNGGTNFTVPIVDLLGNAPAVNSYTFPFSLPNVTCNPYCTAQIKSSSNWYSCFSFRAGGQSDFTSRPQEIRYQCKQVNNMGFCNHLNGKRVNVAIGTNENQLDSQIGLFYQQSINNQNVMTSGTSEDCTSRLKYLLCGQQFEYCGTSAYLKVPDQCYCADTIQACGVTESHQSLFDCSKSPACPAPQKSLAANVKINHASAIFNVWLVNVAVLLMLRI